jgi:peptide/nickel transport system permease protein
VLHFLWRRLAQTLPLLLVISVLVFALIHAAPGGPLDMYLENPNVRPEDIERLRRQLGLDKPLPEQYVAWLISFVRGDWGFSYSDGRPVTERLLERVPATLELVGTSTALAILVSLMVGTLAAARTGVDRVSMVAVVAGISLPTFWFGLVLQLVFANQMGWLPSSGRSSFGATTFADRLSHLILPAIVLASAQAAGWSRYLRGSMKQVLAMPFTVAARAKGASESRILLRHALRNASLPFVTVVLLDASIMASGAVVTESVFAWPGVGGLFTEALARRDYTVLMAFLMCGSIAVAVLNLVADIAVHYLDPRTREAA